MPAGLGVEVAGIGTAAVGSAGAVPPPAAGLRIRWKSEVAVRSGSTRGWCVEIERMIGRTETIPFAGCRSSDRTPPPSSTPENSFWAAGVESRTRRQTIRYRRLATQRRLLLASSASGSRWRPSPATDSRRRTRRRHAWTHSVCCFGVHMGPQLFVRAPSPGLAHRFRLACDEDRHGGNHDDVGSERDQRRGRGMTQAREDQRQVEVGRAFSRCDEELWSVAGSPYRLKLGRVITR